MAKNYEINVAKNCHFVMKNPYCQNIAICKIFLPKICHKLDEHLPYFLSSIWQLCASAHSSRPLSFAGLLI